MTNVGRMRPPLTARLRRSHWMVLDGLAAFVAALVLASSAWGAFHGSARSLPELVLAILLTTLGAVPAALRRARPLPAFVAVMALLLVLGAMRVVEAAIMAFPAARPPAGTPWTRCAACSACSARRTLSPEGRPWLLERRCGPRMAWLT